MSDLNRWMQKHNLCPENILYLYRSDRKTVLHRMDGGEAALYAPMHGVLSVLPEDLFLNISKGIAVNRSQIVNIGNDGVYTMSDGRTFQGRKRGLSSHRRLRMEIGLSDTKPRPMSMSLLEKCSLLDDMPLAFCVIELVFNEDGHGVDFIFRYCNAEMANIEGVPVEEMLNRSFYKVFPNGDKKVAGVLCGCGAERYEAYPPRLQPGGGQIPDHPLLSARTGVLCLCAAGKRALKQQAAWPIQRVMPPFAFVLYRAR